MIASAAILAFSADGRADGTPLEGRIHGTVHAVGPSLTAGGTR